MNPTHLYYNIEIYNNANGYDISGNSIYTVKANTISYVENRANAYLDNPSDYNLTVISFNFDNNYLPLQIVQPLQNSSYYIGQGFPTVYAIAISGNTIPLSNLAHLFWQPPDITIKLDGPITNSNINNEYFWNYDISYFITLLNQTIYNLILSVAPTETIFPYFFYDSTTKRITFNAPLTFTNGTYNLFINGPLQNLLGGFDYIYTQNLYNIRVVNNNNTNIINNNGNPYVQMIQEYNTIQNWNPVHSILLLSPVLPVVDELYATPLILGTRNNVTRANNAGVLNVLFDFTTSQQDNPETNFEPSGQYILASLVGINPVSELQIIMMWEDAFGNLYPLKLETGSGLSLKLLFRKKKFEYKKIEE